MTRIDVSIKEPFGIQWPQQYTILNVSHIGSLDIKNLCMYDSLDHETDADFISFKNNILVIGIMVSLYPFETKKMYISEKSLNIKIPKCLQISKISDMYKICNGNLILQIPKPGIYLKDNIPAPIISVSNNNLSAHGYWKEPFEKADIKVRIENNAVHSKITVKYNFFTQGTLSTDIEIYKGMNEVLITETADILTANCFILKYAFTPQKTYCRMHTPSKTIGVTDEWKRISFNAQNQITQISLQPFYSWDMDTATLIQYYNDNSGICIVPIKASLWENAQMHNIRTYLKDTLVIEAPLNKGSRCWGMSLYNGLAYELNNSISLVTEYQNWENMLNSPIEKIYRSDRLCAIYGGANLTKALEWLSIIPENVSFTPHILADKEEICKTAEHVKNWPWMIKTIQEHKDDKNGFDPAGVYCVTNIEDYALKAKQCISIWLISRIQLLLTFGYSLHELVCIRLSRPIRLVAIDFDLTCHSKHYSMSDRKFIYSSLTFMMKAMESEDYWPDRIKGFKMGNRNFHSDRFSALGILACLLNEYPLSKDIIRYVQKQIDEELEYCIKDNGAWIEAPNYQAYSMNYLITLFTAFKNSSHRNYFNNRQFRKTLEFLSDIQTPYDIRYGAHMIPTIGDTAANYWSQSFSNIFAWAAKMTEGRFSKKMMQAWRRAGSPVFSSGGELNSTFKMLLLTDNTLKSSKKSYKSFVEYEGFGVIARKRQSYLCIKSGDISMHYDHDESSIIWYENNTPILLDIGSQYFPSCDASFMHNRISLDMKTDQSRGSVICAKSNGNIALVITKTEINRIQKWPLWPVTDPNWNFRYQSDPIDVDRHIWKRILIYHIKHKAILVIDELEGTLPYEQNFLFFAKSNKKMENYFHFIGQSDINMNVWVFNGNCSDVLKWSYEGLDEPLFKNAFSMNWKDFTWMWDKPITNMAEEVQILRSSFTPSSRAVTFISADLKGKKIPQNVNFRTQSNIFEWTKNQNKITIYLDGLEDKPLSQIVKETLYDKLH